MLEISINNVIMGFDDGRSFLDGDVHHSDFFMVRKGDKIQIIAGSPNCWWYPCLLQ